MEAAGAPQAAAMTNIMRALILTLESKGLLNRLDIEVMLSLVERGLRAAGGDANNAAADFVNKDFRPSL